MKKINGTYITVCYLIPIMLCTASFAAGALLLRTAPPSVVLGLWLAGLLGLGGIIMFMPHMMSKRMEKKGLDLERDFRYSFKFVAYNAIFYIHTGGRLGVLWRGNPTEIQLADPSALTDIRTNDGKILGGTSLVRCQFRLSGKRYSISTLRIYGGKQYSMKSDCVLEAISKADKICELLNAAKAAALYGAGANAPFPEHFGQAEGVSVWDFLHQND